MMFEYKRMEISEHIREIVDNYKFELNNEQTRQNLKKDIANYLGKSDVLYEIVCDETNNTPEMINNGEFCCEINSPFFEFIFKVEPSDEK